MKIGKNICLIMQGNGDWMGGVEYITNLANALALFRKKENAQYKIFLITAKETSADTIKRVDGFIDKIFYTEDELDPITFYNRVKWYLLRKLLKNPSPRWNRFFRKNGIDCIYPLNALSNKVTKVQIVAWIYDFQHKYLPQFFSPAEIKSRDHDFEHIAKKSNAIVLSSNAAQKDFAKFLPWASHKTHVLSFCSPCQENWYQNDPVQIQKKYTLPDRFLLVSNQFWQHKNHLVIFQALKLLKTDNVKPVIVCTGQLYDSRMPTYCNKILQTINELGIHEMVYLVGLIPKNDQIALMRRSLAIIQPSLFEGWSTIVENARALGKTLILSDLPVHFEQNPDGSQFFKRDDPADLAKIIESIWISKNPGPDHEKEYNAKNENQKLVYAFGRQFLNITKCI